MKSHYLIGVDRGISATKAALYQSDGEQVAEASLEPCRAMPQDEEESC
jgi:sugar (pentulose or hexulose) kinase